MPTPRTPLVRMRRLPRIRDVGPSLTISMGIILVVANATAGPISSSAVTINQIGFRGGPNSVVGEIAINRALAGGTGFVNVVRNVPSPISPDWLVQNLPVLPEPYDHPTITTRLDLTALAGANGTRITSPASLVIDYSTAPSATLAEVLARGTAPASYSVGTKSIAVGSVGTTTVSGYQASPNYFGIPFTPGGIPLLNFVYQSGHPNVQAAANQCAPAAVANSLQWLENTTNLIIPEPNVPGFGDDGSLVGDLETTMGRQIGASRGDVNGSRGVWPMDGKMAYIAVRNLTAKLILKHLVDGNANNAGTALNGNANYTHIGVTSMGAGATFSIAWIIGELAKGEDLEFDLSYQAGGRHYVQGLGAGYILGVPFLLHSSDKAQTDVDPMDNQGTDDVDFEWIDDATGLARNSNAIIDQVLSESVKTNVPDLSPGVLVALTLLLVGAGAYAIRRRPTDLA